MNHCLIIACGVLTLTSWISCGVNVDSAIANRPVYYPYANTPAIFGLQPQQHPDPDSNFYRFQLNYFVTNQEQNFIGYNVYISLHSRTAESIVSAGQVDGPEGPFSPAGVLPSFVHLVDGSEAGEMVSQTIDYFFASPARTPFYTCQRYYFRLTAYLSSQLESLPSAQVSRCATSTGGSEAMCPARSSCAP